MSPSMKNCAVIKMVTRKAKSKGATHKAWPHCWTAQRGSLQPPCHVRTPPSGTCKLIILAHCQLASCASRLQKTIKHSLHTGLLQARGFAGQGGWVPHQQKPLVWPSLGPSGYYYRAIGAACKCHHCDLPLS